MLDDARRCCSLALVDTRASRLHDADDQSSNDEMDVFGEEVDKF